MNKTESAELILRLYELRREEVMREGRNWFSSFFPESIDDIMAALMDEKSSAYYRMVTSYWEMAASFVNQGAIDEEMFKEAIGEHIVVFSKIYPFISDLREKFNSPNMFGNLEKLVMRMPDAENMLTTRREMMKTWMEKRQEKKQKTWST